MSAASQEELSSRARQEILRDGIVEDALLNEHFHTPVYGFNLACSWPLPERAAAVYSKLCERLSALGPEVYVYPAWQMHVTIVTFVNFTLFKNVEPALKEELEELIPPVKNLIQRAVRESKFDLVFGRPILTRKAAILPIKDAAGVIPRIRQNIRAELEQSPALKSDLTQKGLNIPGIVHSTFLRFRHAPSDLPKFLGEFDKIAAEAEPFSATVEELLMTTETRIYMLEGEVAHRFILP